MDDIIALMLVNGLEVVGTLREPFDGQTYRLKDCLSFNINRTHDGMSLSLRPVSLLLNKETDMDLNREHVIFPFSPHDGIVNLYVQHRSNIVIPTAPSQFVKG